MGMVARRTPRATQQHGRLSSAAAAIAVTLVFLPVECRNHSSCPISTPSNLGEDLAICTTITVTSTTSTSTSTTPNITSTHTVSTQRRECREYCSGNGHPWFIKCSWPTCAICLECNTLVIPNPPDQTTPTPSPGPPSTSLQGLSTSAPMDNTLTTSLTVPTPAPTPSPDRRRRSTTTTAQQPAQLCVSTCGTSGVPWDTICAWATCALCPECYALTATATATTTSMTLTRTMTTETSTVTTSLSSTTSTETQTNATGPVATITTTTTTLTMTMTTWTTTFTTITTTTTGVSCSPPNPLIPTADCQQPLIAGTNCTARTFATPCVEESTLVFSCPLNNTEEREPNVVVGTYGVNCKVCGMVTSSLMDSDTRIGWITAVLRFGPNILNGVIDEAQIEGYAIFMVDECGRMIGDVLDTIPKKGFSTSSCCQYDAYVHEFTAALPNVNFTGAAIAILPNTSVGLVPIGATTDFIEDVGLDVDRFRGTVGGASRPGGGQGSLPLRLAFAFAFAFAWLAFPC